MFMTCQLISEHYDTPDADSQVPANHLVGSLASSIHRLRDTEGYEGGYFVFGDLSVKCEGRFRLRFSLFEREETSAGPGFRFVDELVTNVFTVHPAKSFPGMADSTPLTRVFSDQGVKVRLRKDSNTLAARKRARPRTDTNVGALLERSKRPSYERNMSFGSYGLSDVEHFEPSTGSSIFSSTTVPTSQLYVPYAPVVSSAGGLMELPLPTTGYYFDGVQYY